MGLGANISKVMPQEGSAVAHHTLPITALVIAATNERRDGTEMLRILLSKGASPKELDAAEVDGTSLGLGMKYWIDKANRVGKSLYQSLLGFDWLHYELASSNQNLICQPGVPHPRELCHLKKVPHMDRIHELDYAVVGEEAAVSVIKEALAGRFGNPQGNTKPLVMLLLGPPGIHFFSAGD